MKRTSARRLICAIAALVAVAAAFPADADAQSRTYVAGYGARAGGSDAVPVGIGGVTFAARATTPSAITVNDASGGVVFFTACQDVNADALCGTDEPFRAFCSTSGRPAPLPGFRANVATTVFVYVTEDVLNLYPRSIPCAEALATVGTITLT